ncbi:DUF1800 domain-containing protein [Agaribacter flavus]|uniref:DUF1800 family protein n=1 Tax=Agaribacter flavus TaxID=1902781 RepID=A0ABV7FTB3_9ALTE
MQVLYVLFTIFFSSLVLANSQVLNLKVIDKATGLPIANQSITAQQITPTGKVWYANKTSNAQGEITWKLSGLGIDKFYQLSTKISSGRWIRSTIIKDTGKFEWGIGLVTVTIKDGSVDNNIPLKNYDVQLLSMQNNEIIKRSYFKTDANGKILLNLPSINDNVVYKLKAASTVDKKANFYHTIKSYGNQDFIVGVKPLSIVLKNMQNNSTINDIEVTAWAPKNDGSKKWLSKKTTDKSGKIDFVLPSLAKGENVQLTANIFNGRKSTSQMFTTPGNFIFEVGKLSVSVLDGSKAQNEALANYKVALTIYNGHTKKHRWKTELITNASGKVLVDLSSLNTDESYILSAISKTDNKIKYSRPLPLTGSIEFVVGNPPTTVSVVNASTNMVEAGIKVTAQKKSDEGKWVWASTQVTDSNGIAVFDLDDILEGKEYRIKTAKYKGDVISETITEPSEVTLILGAINVHLWDRDSKQNLSNIKIFVYRVDADGALIYQSAGITDSEGKLIFDVGNIKKNNYVLKVIQPFAGVSHLYSKTIRSSSVLDFSVSKYDDKTFDSISPKVRIISPIKQSVSNEGFILSGSVYDNKDLNNLVIEVSDGFNASHQKIITNPTVGDWQIDIPSDWLTLQATIEVTVTAYDKTGNAALDTKTFNVVEDIEAPTINVESHQPDEEVSENGFTISGQVKDNIQVASLNASMANDKLGIIFFERDIEFNPNTGQWAIYIDENSLSSESSQSFTFNAYDASGNINSKSLNLTTNQKTIPLKHLLSRTTFGISKSLQDEVESMGVYNWLQEQMAPELIDDSSAEVLVAQIEVDSIQSLRKRELTYQLYSKRQLQQVMAFFWENHFSTNYNSHKKIAYEIAENGAFRELALTNFRSILAASAQSPAMLMYLSNHKSVKGNPNENYARELMELHTLGESGGYTETDVVELARIFTGWQVDSDGQFIFNESDHDVESKVFLGHDITPNGASEGELALGILAQHPSTAAFVCQKLVQYLVADIPPGRLVFDCAKAFKATNGDITSILNTIFDSAEFSAEENISAKIKTPLKLYTSAIRSLDA